MSGLEVGLPETPLYYMPTSSPVRKCRHRKVRNKILAKIGINSRSRHSFKTQFVLTLPWISLHPKINLLGSRRASFIPEMTSKWACSERSSKASPMGFLYTELSKKQRQSKDGQITPRTILDLHKFYTIGKLVSRAISSVSFVYLTIL